MSSIVPMEITNETSHQEVFDFVLNAIFKQGAPSVRKGGSCAYRGDVKMGSKTACGIGHLLNDEESETYEGKTVNSFCKSIKRFDNLSSNFLQSLQDCHDRAFNFNRGNATSRLFMSCFLENMKKVSFEYGLNFNPPQ